jgi:hypothetical protein
MQEGTGGNWAREPHLSPEHLSSVRGLNQRFLDLADLTADDWLPAAGLTEQLAPLSETQRAAVANCPYALFDLRFEDEAYWTARLAQPALHRVADEPVAEEVVDFARLALFYAWHVSCTAGLAAQLLLGMSATTVETFRGCSVNDLPALAAAEAVNLGARWRDSAAYWSALIGAALRSDAAELRRVQLYGLQLAAAARLP